MTKLLPTATWDNNVHNLPNVGSHTAPLYTLGRDSYILSNPKPLPNRNPAHAYLLSFAPLNYPKTRALRVSPGPPGL